MPEVVPPPELAASIRRTQGMVPGWLTRLAPCPWLVHAVSDLTAAPIAHLPMPLWDLSALIVSRDNSCRFCYGAQRAFLEMMGYGDDDLDRLERDVHGAGLAPADVAALDFARQVSRANPRPGHGDLAALARVGFSPPAVAELAFAAAVTVFANRVSTLLALPTEPWMRAARHPLVRIARPLVRWWFGHRRHAPAPLPEPNGPPCAEVVAALAGSPAARVLRRVIDDAFGSPLVPRRTKLLVLAVVARATSCAHGEAEARGELAREGLSAAEVHGVLAHLGGPGLDDLERLLVPFARETVPYQKPTLLQERVRVVTDGLPPAVTLEVAGVVALANALCRLSVLLDRC